MGPSSDGSAPPEYLAALLMASPEAVVLFDGRGTVVYLNGAAESLFGPVTAGIQALVARAHPDDAEPLRQLLQPAGDEPAG
jgi:PAS domain-containing protein